MRLTDTEGYRGCISTGAYRDMNTYGDTDEEPETHPSVQLKGIRHINTIPSQGSFQSHKQEQEVSRGPG